MLVVCLGKGALEVRPWNLGTWYHHAPARTCSLFVTLSIPAAVASWVPEYAQTLLLHSPGMMTLQLLIVLVTTVMPLME